MKCAQRDKTTSLRASLKTGSLLCGILISAFPSNTLAGDPIQTSAQNAVILLEKSGEIWRSKTKCASCHHQTLPMIANSLSQQSGLYINETLQRGQFDFLTQNLRANRGSVWGRLKDWAINPDPAYMYSFLLWGLTEASHPDFLDRQIAEEIAEYIGSLQESDGSWNSHLDRPPLEGNSFTATAVALRVFNKMGILPERSAKAVRWLVAQSPTTNEERVFQLLGLFWSLETPPDSPIPDPVEAEKIRNQIRIQAKSLAEQQKTDGGWSQISKLESDAYASGQALFALASTSAHHEYKTGNPIYADGLNYLQKTNYEDGSWRVISRSTPIQKRFHTGFPHGANQYISTAGTAWAVMAIAKIRSLEANH